MEFYGKALYNLLRMNPPSHGGKVKSWQVLDYRSLKDEEIFDRLSKLEIFLDPEQFSSYASAVGSPEELAQNLLKELSGLERQEEGFLLIFEAWRRFCPDRPTLSIFCDELDHIIDLYDKNPTYAEDSVQAVLADLEGIADSNADEGKDPEQVLHIINNQCAHDLEGFIYDFIDDHMEQENEIYASELIDGFYAYISDKRWFDLLRLRLLSKTDMDEASIVLSRFLEILEEEFDLNLSLELLRFLIYWEDPKLFLFEFKKISENLLIEGDFHELLEIASEYVAFLGRETEQQEIQSLIEKRKNNEIEKKFRLSDPDLKKLLSIIHRF